MSRATLICSFGVLSLVDHARVHVKSVTNNKNKFHPSP